MVAGAEFILEDDDKINNNEYPAKEVLSIAITIIHHMRYENVIIFLLLFLLLLLVGHNK